jgi:hypothetical protein
MKDIKLSRFDWDIADLDRKPEPTSATSKIAALRN